MLTHITINQFMLVDHLDLSVKSGMTTITGETGTGKSILLDALSLALGERAEGDRVRHGADKADITATFLLDDLPLAREWLMENDLSHDDECLMRRVVTKEGRSRGFINGQPVTLQQMRALGEVLVDIHSQHAHQALLSKQSHFRLLDEFAQHQPLVADVKVAYQSWQQLHQKFIDLRDNAEEANARFQLLQYQVEEFEQLNLEPGEIARLEQEQQSLANAETLLTQGQQIAELCEQGDSSVRQQLYQALSILQGIRPQTDALQGAGELLNTALIHVEEAHQTIAQQMERVEINPERLQSIDERLSTIYTLARKHHINPDELLEKFEQLSNELAQVAGGEDRLAELETQCEAAKTRFMSLAKQLSSQRQVAAETLSAAINEQLTKLAMQSANFTVACTPRFDKPTLQGVDEVEFLISTNPGQPHKSLNKVVSGGELSRISLAIQVITASTSGVATLIFDEVDVGIGGRTADVVGRMLAQLGVNAQVVCITHLAQVASKAAQHWQVTKQSDDDTTSSTIISLEGDQRIEEIARMISGDALTEQSIAHARELVV